MLHLLEAISKISTLEEAEGRKQFFFAAGINDTNLIFHNGDIYDVTTNTWSVNHLSAPRDAVAAASVGNKVVFAGGMNGNKLEDKVDIFDVSSNS